MNTSYKLLQDYVEKFHSKVENKIGTYLGWVVMFPIWFLYLFIVEPICWIIYAPVSVYEGARDLVIKWITGKEPDHG